MSSRFDALVEVNDNTVLSEFGVSLRWTREDESTQTITGIIDIKLEMLGPHGELSYIDKAITAKSSVVAGWKRGETVQELDDDGNPTGPVYELVELAEQDGGFTVIEVIS